MFSLKAADPKQKGEQEYIYIYIIHIYPELQTPAIETMVGLHGIDIV